MSRDTAGAKAPAIDHERVVIARVVRPRGVRGEVVAESLTDVPERFETLHSAFVDELPVTLAEAWPHKSGWVLKFVGIDSMDAAEKLRGGELWVPFEERGSLEEGEYFESDLIGCKLIDARSGEPVGTVEGWLRGGGAPLMEVNCGSRQSLVPFVSARCKVDLGARTISTEIPEGLLEL